jgi:hypothetical protein
MESGAGGNDGTDESADRWDPLVDLEGAHSLIECQLFICSIFVKHCVKSSDGCHCYAR